MDEQGGQTPLDPDEKAGLIPAYLAAQSDLNDWEQENILRAARWMRRVRAPQVLSEGFAESCTSRCSVRLGRGRARFANRTRT